LGGPGGRRGPDRPALPSRWTLSWKGVIKVTVPRERCRGIRWGASLLERLEGDANLPEAIRTQVRDLRRTYPTVGQLKDHLAAGTNGLPPAWTSAIQEAHRLFNTLSLTHDHEQLERVKAQTSRLAAAADAKMAEAVEAYQAAGNVVAALQQATVLRATFETYVRAVNPDPALARRELARLGLSAEGPQRRF